VEAFGGRALLARAGLILGPYEITGRMPWWLRRIERGGDVLAPGPPDLPVQYIDGRDLAAWLLHAADDRVGGVINTVSKPGQATMRSLLEAARAATGSPAHMVWVPPEVITRAGIAPWTELPVWVPPDSELIGLHTGDVSAAYAAGLSCRPIEETVADTWAWLQAEGDPPPTPDRPAHGVDPDREREVLAMTPTPRVRHDDGPTGGLPVPVKMRAIDFHVHLPTPDWLDGSMAGYVEAAEAYFRSPVQRRSIPDLAEMYRRLETMAVLLAWDAETATGRPRVPNETVAAACRDHPDVFTGLGSVDPHKGEAAVAEVANIAALGLRGVKFHPSLQAFAPDDKTYWPVFAACERHGLLALFHTGTSGIGARQPGGQGIALDYARPIRLDAVAAPPRADRGGSAFRLAMAYGAGRHGAAQDQRTSTSPAGRPAASHPNW
jgi:hypothetical protein